MVEMIPDGTDVCYYGDIQAKIGGYNGIDHLIVERDDDGPDVWSSNFVLGFCPSQPPVADSKMNVVFMLIIAAVIYIMFLGG